MLLAYTYNTDLSELMYLCEDFMIYIPLAFLVIRSQPERSLDGTGPTARVFGVFRPIVS